VTQGELAGMPAPRPAMLEKDLQKGVIDIARLFGWRVAHFRPAWTTKGMRTAVAADGAGFPDLVLVRDRVLWIELKVAGRTLSADQADWANALRAAGETFHVWTENDWYDGAIEANLRRADRTAESADRTAFPRENDAA
jgi:hypothetical protein